MIPRSVDYARGNVCCWRTALLHARSNGPLNAYTGLAVEIEYAQAFSATSRATELAECLTPNPDGFDPASRAV